VTIEVLAQIIAPPPRPFAAGIVLWDDKVVETADIVRFMKKWDRNKVRIYCRSKGWTVTVVWQMQVKGYE